MRAAEASGSRRWHRSTRAFRRRLYGGTERVVSYLTEELVTLGHDVTLFASGDSRDARPGSCPDRPRALRLDEAGATRSRGTSSTSSMSSNARPTSTSSTSTSDYLHFPFARRTGTPRLTTLHGRLDLPDLVPVYREYEEIPLVSISDAQRVPLPHANWQGTVHHGLPRDLLPLRRGPAATSPSSVGSLRKSAWTARSRSRGGRDAAADRGQGRPAPTRDYFDREIRTLLRQPHVEFVGEISEEREARLPRIGARALLFPIDWPEPFGLVMIEAMACGTPIIAFRAGSVEEIVEDGVNGCVVDTVPDAVRAVENLAGVERAVPDALRGAIHRAPDGARLPEALRAGWPSPRRPGTVRGRRKDPDYERRARGYRQPVRDSGVVGAAGRLDERPEGGRHLRGRRPLRRHCSGRDRRSRALPPGTRYLSRLAMGLDGGRPFLLSSGVRRGQRRPSWPT